MDSLTLTGCIGYEHKEGTWVPHGEKPGAEDADGGKAAVARARRERE